MFKTLDCSLLFAAAVSCLTSVALWFLVSRDCGVSVGLWVPSILILWVGVRLAQHARPGAPVSVKD